MSDNSNADDAAVLEIEDNVATITLNDPERYNPWSDALVGDLEACLDEARGAEPSLLILQGAGDAFSAGGDIERMHNQIEGGMTPEERVRHVERENWIAKKLAKFPYPTMAKVDGPAAGAGAVLAMACDIQLANEDATFSIAFRNVGLNIDGGASGLLPRIVGNNVAKELAFTGKFIEAERAEELGIYNHVYPNDEFEDRFQEMADEIANGPTMAIRYSKKLIDESHTKSLEQALEDEALAQGSIMQSHDHREGVEAFLEDREPEFIGE